MEVGAGRVPRSGYRGDTAGALQLRFTSWTHAGHMIRAQDGKSSCRPVAPEATDPTMSVPDTRLTAPRPVRARRPVGGHPERILGLPLLDRPDVGGRGSIVTAIRDAAAVVGARSVSAVMRLGGQGATSMPGLAAVRISPGVDGRIAARVRRSVLVSGTNGKTGTSSLLATILIEAGDAPVRNASGANLRQGIATVLTTSSTIGGALRDPSAIALFETDEAVLPAVAAWLPGTVMVLTNLLRDQLDRYGETDHLVRLWATMLAERPPRGGLVYCVDDPRLAAVVAETATPLHGFALEGQPPVGTGAQLTLEPATCPVCQHELSVAGGRTGRAVDYSCLSCGFRRPEPDCVVNVVEDRGLDGQTLRFAWADGETETVDVALPGLGNAYNAAAAVTAAAVLGIPTRGPRSARSLQLRRPSARFEHFEVDGRRSCSRCSRTRRRMAELTRSRPGARVDRMVVALNDAFADGRDVSWYWDCSPADLVAGRPYRLAGRRAADFAVAPQVRGRGRPRRGVRRTIGWASSTDPTAGRGPSASPRHPSAVTVLVVATYTALLGDPRRLRRTGRSIPADAAMRPRPCPTASSSPTCFPTPLNLYGDRGNIDTLVRRAAWRGHRRPRSGASARATPRGAPRGRRDLHRRRRRPAPALGGRRARRALGAAPAGDGRGSRAAGGLRRLPGPGPRVPLPAGRRDPRARACSTSRPRCSRRRGALRRRDGRRARTGLAHRRRCRSGRRRRAGAAPDASSVSRTTAGRTSARPDDAAARARAGRPRQRRQRASKVPSRCPGDGGLARTADRHVPARPAAAAEPAPRRLRSRLRYRTRHRRPARTASERGRVDGARKVRGRLAGNQPGPGATIAAGAHGRPPRRAGRRPALTGHPRWSVRSRAPRGRG